MVCPLAKKQVNNKKVRKAGLSIAVRIWFDIILVAKPYFIKKLLDLPYFLYCNKFPNAPNDLFKLLILFDHRQNITCRIVKPGNFRTSSAKNMIGICFKMGHIIV